MAKKTKSHDFSNPGEVQDVELYEATRRRYLNYAISVITSRALPDVRDGLKPVQRRILYTMFHDLHIYPDRKSLKCAKVVGLVLGNYHPHGDTAIYDALVRMAQNWVLRYPLVFGQGNFGSLDGDGPAAFRYTEARLLPVAMRLLEELREDTVEFRPNFDGTDKEPVVLPARLPNLLVNGSSGIAVGMATSIPPHNLCEVVDACIALIERRTIDVADLVKIVKGPDFPIGGEILNSRSDLRKVYEEGHGSVRVRGEYKIEKTDRGGTPQIVIYSIPYEIKKGALVESIGDLILNRKVPQLLDVRDESTDDVRIVLEIKKEASPEMIMAYLYKHTPLQSNVQVNLTCLVPQDQGPPAPRRLNLKEMLDCFVRFRYDVVERRYRHELRLLQERCHILEGFRKIFDALDEAIRIIRKSEGKKDAATKLMERFKLDEIQTDAILEMKLYKIARLEIKLVIDELRTKRQRIKEIEALLGSPSRIWTVVKKELHEVSKEFGDNRRTRVSVSGHEDVVYDAEAFIVDEDATILVTRDGWVRRVQRVGDLSKVRLRQDDELIAVLGGNTRSAITFFSNFGTAYTIRINDIPPSPRGFGDPIQGMFKFKDGERIVAAVSMDPRVLDEDDIGSEKTVAEYIPAVHGLAISTSGYGLRFAVFPYAEASTRSGRRFARVKPGEEIVNVKIVEGDEVVITASKKGRALLCKAEEINFLGGPGRGVQVLKIAKDDEVIGFAVSQRPSDGLTVVREGGKTIPILPRSYRVTSRAGKGFEVIKRGKLKGIVPPPIKVPDFLNPDTDEKNGAPGKKKKK
jgi:DNA gyrase subunit A